MNLYRDMTARLNTLTSAHKKPSGIILSICGFAFFAFSDTAYKFVAGSYPPLVTGFYAFSTALCVTLLLAFAGGGVRQKLATKKLKLHLTRGLILSANFFLFIYGLSGLQLAEAYSIDAFSPMVAALLAFFLLKEKLGAKRVLCILGGMIGVLIILRPGFIPLNLYALSILGGTFAFALANVINRKIGESDTPLSFAFYGLIVGITVCFFYNVSIGWIVPEARDLLFMMAAGFIAVIADISLARAFSLIDVALASKFQYTQILWGTLLGYLLFNHLPDFWTVAGAIVIIASASMMVYLEHRESAKQASVLGS